MDFYLNDKQIAWVEKAYVSMDTPEKVQQLFVQMNHDRREESIKAKVETHRQGGLRWQGGDTCTTLVKDTQNLLARASAPSCTTSSPSPRVFTGSTIPFRIFKEEIAHPRSEVDVAPNLFELDRTNPAMSCPIMMSIGKHETFRETYDVIFIVGYMKGYAQENNVRLAFSCGRSNEMPWYIHEVPTVGISLNYNNHLIDLAQVKTYIHAYGPDRACVRAALKKAHGIGEFMGTASDTDFCGRWDTRLCSNKKSRPAFTGRDFS